MASPISTVSRATEDQVLATLLRLREELEYVPNEDVRNAARILNCSTRRIRRMLQRGYVRQGTRAWTPDPTECQTLLVKCSGRISALKEALEEDGKAPGVSLRTMQRGFASRYSQQQLAGARKGYKAMWAMCPTVDHEVEVRNEEWCMDHTKLPVWVRYPDGTVEKPWLTTVMDSATRMILAITVGPDTPTTEESVETVAVAVEGYTSEETGFVGGVPGALLSDRGGDFIARAMTLGLIEQNVDRRFTEGYAPHQNGRIEKWHRTIKEEACPKLVGFAREDWTARDDRKEGSPIEDPEMLLPIEAVTFEVLKWVRKYNTERTHSSLRGLTPAQAWANDTTEIRRADVGAVRAAMTQQDKRTVSRGLVRHKNLKYRLSDDKTTVNGVEHYWRDLVEGKEVIVRYLRTRPEFVDLFSMETGESIGRAKATKWANSDDGDKHLAHRRRHIATLNATIEAIAQANADSVQAARDAALSAQPADDWEVAFGPGPAPKASKSRKRTQTAATAERKRKAAEAKRVRLDALDESVTSKAPSNTEAPGDSQDLLDALNGSVQDPAPPPADGVANADEQARLDALAAAVNTRLTPDNAVGL